MKQVKKQKVQPKKAEETLSYTVEVRDKEGRVIQRISAPSRSYVEQWNQAIFVQASQSNFLFKKTDGTLENIDENANTLKVTAPIGSSAYGIVVGKGSTAVAIDDYALETQCVEGTGTDEFNHQAVTYPGGYPAVVGSTCSFTIKRILVNNSGATILIREIGCYIIVYVSRNVLGFRDVLPGTVTVPSGGSITVTYTIAVTV